MNLVICGDFEPFALKISKPEEALVSSIIERVATTLDVPSAEISLYFNDKLLQPASPFSPQCGTQLRSGAALLVVATPLIITIQRYNTDGSFNVEVSRLAAPRWKTDTLFDFCLWKAGMPKRNDGKYIFVVQETVLERDKRISDYKFLDNSFTISITFLQALLCQDPITTDCHGIYSRSVLIPTGCTTNGEKVLSSEQTKNTYISTINITSIDEFQCIQVGNPSKKQSKYYGQWKLTIQAIDGMKRIVELENHFLTPVYELRSKVSDGNVRLTIGNTVLEDWDEEGRIMLLCSYPQLHDGATLYQINLPDAIRVDCQYQYGYIPKTIRINLHKPLDQALDEHFKIKCPQFMCMENKKKSTVERFFRAMRNFGHDTSVQTNDGESMSIHELFQKSTPKFNYAVTCIRSVVLH